MNYFFNPQARLEHLEHVAYYESRQKGLGARYLAAFNSAMVKICEAPHRHKAVFQPDIRRYRIPGFPYNALYRHIGSVARFWWLLRTVGARIIGSTGFKALPFGCNFMQLCLKFGDFGV